MRVATAGRASWAIEKGGIDMDTFGFDLGVLEEKRGVPPGCQKYTNVNLTTTIAGVRGVFESAWRAKDGTKAIAFFPIPLLRTAFGATRYRVYESVLQPRTGSMGTLLLRSSSPCRA